MSRRKKWDKINDLIDRLYHRTYKPGDLGNLHCICYAPNIGYRSWIFKYEGVLVALFDEGNDHYSFHMPVNWLDVLMAKVCSIWYEFLYKLK